MYFIRYSRTALVCNILHLSVRRYGLKFNIHNPSVRGGSLIIPRILSTSFEFVNDFTFSHLLFNEDLKAFISIRIIHINIKPWCKASSPFDTSFMSRSKLI